VGRAPVHLDDPAVGAAVDADPIARPVRAAEIQHDAREDVAQRALQRQSENDRDNARGREQASDRQIEDIGNDREYRGKVDQTSEQILDQLPFAWPALGNNKDAQNADQKPSGPQPPRDLQHGVDRILKRHTGSGQRLVGNDSGIQQHQRQHDEKDYAHDRKAERTAPE
jgi:hypothetical protein